MLANKESSMVDRSEKSGLTDHLIKIYEIIFIDFENKYNNWK